MMNLSKLKSSCQLSGGGGGGGGHRDTSPVYLLLHSKLPGTVLVHLLTAVCCPANSFKMSHIIGFFTLKAPITTELVGFCHLLKCLRSLDQTVLTQIRLLLQQQSDLVPHCLLLCLHKPQLLAIICSRQLAQTTFSDAFLAGDISFKSSYLHDFSCINKKKCFYQGGRYLWPHCCMNNLYISNRSL